MTTTDTDIKQREIFHIKREDFNLVSDAIYDSISSSPALTDGFAEWLKDVLDKNVFTQREQRAAIIGFLTKLQTLKEISETLQDNSLLEEKKRAARSFSGKTRINP
ncbi:hypothetical protein [Emticicia sp. TH156]|uniref:hypothetical protein n=1 Tax=Emticicia sp. TH156 TaxID=2067454 RepID=UPI000C75EC27|nr:hypothetical protein [Emticicia sp. TH156]PLK44334.1 hypothetical protein C0V77_11115 [Emticicia sp. TH156]